MRRKEEDKDEEGKQIIKCVRETGIQTASYLCVSKRRTLDKLLIDSPSVISHTWSETDAKSRMKKKERNEIKFTIWYIIQHHNEPKNFVCNLSLFLFAWI